MGKEAQRDLLVRGLVDANLGMARPDRYAEFWQSHAQSCLSRFSLQSLHGLASQDQVFGALLEVSANRGSLDWAQRSDLHDIAAR